MSWVITVREETFHELLDNSVGNSDVAAALSLTL
jgi:hypothetical protein